MKTEASRPLHLPTTPELITLQPTLLVYLKKTVPFQQHALLAWKEFWHLAGGKFDPSQIAGMG